VYRLGSIDVVRRLDHGSMRAMLAAVFLVCVLSSCADSVDDVVLVSTPITVTQEALEIDFDTPIHRTRKSGSLLVTLDVDWHPEPPWQYVTLADGTRITVSFTLVTDTGEEHTSSILGGSYGEAGALLNVRYDPEIPRSESIVSLRVSASQPLILKSIVWHNFNPL